MSVSCPTPRQNYNRAVNRSRAVDHYPIEPIQEELSGLRHIYHNFRNADKLHRLRTISAPLHAGVYDAEYLVGGFDRINYIRHPLEG